MGAFDNYQYRESGNPQQPQQGQPQVVYVDPLMSDQNLGKEVAQHYHMVRMRSANAQCRSMELHIIMESMQELRTALCVNTIADNDSGSGDRPPLEKAFDDINRGKLQEAYLYLVERMCNYTDAMMTQLAIKTTNEIKEKK